MFFCYSYRLKRALLDYGFKVSYIGYNQNTNSFFYAFLASKELQQFKDEVYPRLRDKY